MKHLKEDWSPEQISGCLKLEGIFISHESIYRYVRVDKAIGGSLFRHLRHGNKKYCSKIPLVTVVERKSKFLKIKKVKNKTKEVVGKAIVKMLKPLKNQVDSMTYDNGGEFAGHEEIAKKLKAKTYFATPYHSWERT